MRRPLPPSYLGNLLKGYLLGDPENIERVKKSVDISYDGSPRQCDPMPCIMRNYVDILGVIEAAVPASAVSSARYRALNAQEQSQIKAKKLRLGTENDSALCAGAGLKNKGEACPLEVYIGTHTAPASIGLVGDLGSFAFEGQAVDAPSPVSAAYTGSAPAPSLLAEAPLSRSAKTARR